MVILLLGCAAGGDTGAVDDSAVGDAPYLADADPAGEPLAIEALEAAIQARIDAALGESARALHDAYQSQLAASDESCPQWSADMSSWSGACASGAGGEFSGWISQTRYSGARDVDGYLVDGLELSGVAAMSSPSGELDIKGSLSDLTRVWDDESDPHQVWASELDGRFSWAGWASIEQAGIEIEVIYDVATGAKSFSAHGSLTGDFGDVDMIDWYYASLDTSSDCPQEISGQLYLRDLSGGTYEVVFDTQETGTESALCDGCGAAFYEGAPLGDACVDASALTGWEAAPW